MRHFLIGPMLCLLAGLTSVAGAAAAPAAALPTAAPASAAMPAEHAPAGAKQRHRPKPVEHHVDINSASRKELMTLPGIGKDEADRIVAHRPYLTKTELVSKGVLPTGPFLSIKRQVVAFPKNIGAKQKPAKLAVAAQQDSPR